MVPVPTSLRHAHSSRLLYSILTLSAQHVQRLLRRDGATLVNPPERRSTRFNPHTPKEIVFVILIPVLVLLSGVFAGLTLGYMSLDETQLNVLSISGTPKQKEYANKIKPVRKNGHLLLVTLLLANMIVNETLPVIADPVLGGGLPSVVVSTVLIVIFAEIIPQSLFTRHGLYLGAKMAGFTQILIYAMGIISWPVAKFLEFVLGRHHGIIYRRAELKELIAMHSSHATHGGDLKTDTVTIIGATLDLQEKVVKQAMTPISDVFMLSIDSNLDYNTLRKVCGTGHSRIPVYEEVDVLVSSIAPNGTITPGSAQEQPRTQRVKKIVGILLVKQCVLLDPKDATPLRNIRLNKVPFVPNNEPLLGILDKFQEGRSHMAIVSRFSVDKAASVKKAVKQGLTQRLRKRVGMDTDSDTDSSEDEKSDGNRKKRAGRRRANRNKDIEEGVTDDGTTSEGDSARINEIDFAKSSEKNDQTTARKFTRKDKKSYSGENNDLVPAAGDEGKKSKITTFQLPAAAMEMASMSMLEQRMPADAVLAKENAEEFLQNFDPAVMPLGIITLEDVLEELIGEEIYDEFDPQGAHGDPYEIPVDHSHEPRTAAGVYVETVDITSNIKAPTPIFKPMALKGLGFLRSRSAPPVPRDEVPHIENNNVDPQFHGDVATTALTLNPTMESQVTAVEMPQPMLVPGNVRPVVAEQPSSSFVGIGSSAVDETKLKPVATNPMNLSIPLPAMSAIDPWGTSPAPSLEAILLDRKRRLAAASSGNTFPSVPPSVASSIANLTLAVNDGSTPNVARAVGGTPKGTRFKSSPLITGKSEVVNGKDEKGREVRKDGGQEEGRISNDIEKSGPDIPE